MAKARVAAIAAMLLAGALASAARAGEWQYDPGSDVIFHGGVAVGQWYGWRPSMAAPAYRAPRHVTPCPHRMCGYPLPIHKARPAARSIAHAEWCAGRYRSYDARTGTYQPHRGPSRLCRSPWR